MARFTIVVAEIELRKITIQALPTVASVTM